MKRSFHFLTTRDNPDKKADWTAYRYTVMEAVLLSLQQEGILDPVQFRKAVQLLRQQKNRDGND